MWIAKGFIMLMVLIYAAAATNAYLDGEGVISLVLVLLTGWGVAAMWQLLKVRG